ncbi:MAG: hypothetical protein ACYTFT_13845 [Planctomycetota bacterium]|jgi:hypothetical protein
MSKFIRIATLSAALAIVGATAATGVCRADEEGGRYARHVEALKKKLPGPGFHILVEKPFVVVGDESEAMVKKRAAGTIRWAVKHLKASYFAKDPEHIVDVWLFKDKASYEKNAIKLWGEKPSTPYGYYSPSERVLVMNISTGGGTLVHEMVHPFIESNFPDCPSWFNEGLASLYEQCQEKDGKIRGLTNWRLANLQKLIKREELGSLTSLLKTSRRQFYRGAGGDSYAQARYLCYYLQESGKLRAFYHGFVKDASGDSTGLTTLKRVLETEDLAGFEVKWRAWILKRRFPEQKPDAEY